MEAELRFHRKTLEEAVVDHRRRAALALLGRLEQKINGAVELGIAAQVGRRPQQHGRVAVVATGMHPAGVARVVVKIVFLLDRQRVHVGTQADGSRTRAGAQHTDHSGLADAAVGFDAQRFEPRGHQRGGAMLLESEFRMGMDVAANRGNVRVLTAQRV